MGQAALEPRTTVSEFLAWEGRETVRHEFVAGGVYALAGADERHVTVSGNVFMALRQHLRGSACRTFMADMKVCVDAAESVFYPDVLVTCSTKDTDPLAKREPLLVVEVLSRSTAAFDRGDKFAAYRLLPSLREYLLIDHEKRRCDLFRLGTDGL